MKPKEEMSNYEKCCEQWRIKFLELDQIALMKRISELRDEGEWLTLFHFGRKFGVNRIDGQIIAMEDKKPVPDTSPCTLISFDSVKESRTNPKARFPYLLLLRLLSG